MKPRPHATAAPAQRTLSGDDERSRGTVVTPADIGVKLPTPDIADIKKLAPHAKKLSSLVLQRQGIAAKLKALETQRRELDAQIQPILFRANVKKVMVEDFSVSVVESGHTKLDKLKLIEHGVAPEIIAQCEEYVPHSPYVRIEGKRDR